MNSQIYKIAEQLGLRSETMVDDSGKDTLCYLTSSGSVPSVETWEKFAELIVRECINSIKHTIGMNCINADNRVGCNMAIEDIEEHFGVKE